MGYVMRQGKRIETVEIPLTLTPEAEARLQAQARRHKGKAERARNTFVMVPLGWGRQMTRATRSPKAFVALWLLHLAWKAGSSTVTLSNKSLRDHGVSRMTKLRALRELEEAGLITVERHLGRATVVTLLQHKC